MEAAAVTHAEHHGPPPAHRSSRVEAPVLGMLLFIISEVMIFGAFFTAYFFIRVVTHDPWPAHGTNVIIGLGALLIVTIRSFRGHYSPEHHQGMEVPGIYWHFVDAMWIVVYTTVYVL